MPFIIRGIHPVEAKEPCFLIEAEVNGEDSFDWGKVTQENPMQPSSNWQVAYDEQLIDAARGAWVFFFHYLDFNKPLLTSAGSVELLPPAPRPAYLDDVEYFEP
jgi:hypothetical protein